MNGLLKNADEGIANSKLIGVFSLLLLGGSVLPIFSFAHAVYYGWPAGSQSKMWATILLAIATVFSFAPRLMIARQLSQSMVGVWLHPLAVLWFVGLQWKAFLRKATGAEAIAWRGRS